MKAHAAKRADRPPRERDLMELLENSHERERRVADALVVILTRGDAEVLAALGIVVGFAVRTARKAR